MPEKIYNGIYYHLMIDAEKEEGVGAIINPPGIREKSCKILSCFLGLFNYCSVRRIDRAKKYFI